MNSAAQRQTRITRLFEDRFGNRPSVWCRAPGRVDLMGSHTDYNQGYVLTLPIERDAWIAARPRADRVVRLWSVNVGAEVTFNLGRLDRDSTGHWGNYVRGVAQALEAEGLSLAGFDGVLHSTVPLSSGLSSSAALECAVATAFESLGGWKLDPVKKACLCQRAENEYVGVNCGILDQYTSCMGQSGCALRLDCRDLSSRSVRLADGIQVVICDTKSKRELAGSEYGQRRAQCEAGARQLGVESLREIARRDFDRREAELPPETAKRCRFILEESDRVLALETALIAGDRNAIRQLCADSFHGAVTLYEIAAPAMHTMMKAMLTAPGIMGARQAGAGFGGCMVAFVDQDQTDAFTVAASQEYERAAGIRPDVFPVAAAEGAGAIGL